MYIIVQRSLVHCKIETGHTGDRMRMSNFSFVFDVWESELVLVFHCLKVLCFKINDKCLCLEIVFHCLRMWWVMKRHKNPHGGQHKRCHLEMEEFLWEWNKLESPDLARTTGLANKVSIFCFSNLQIFSETNMVRLFPRILAESFYNFFLKRQHYLWKFGPLRLSKKGI